MAEIINPTRLNIGEDMNRLEHLLVIFAEECSEIAQETSKALRFGVDEKQTPETPSNLQRMSIEWNQLMAMREMLHDEGLFLPIDSEVRRKKKANVEKYLLFSDECGTLNE